MGARALPAKLSQFARTRSGPFCTEDRLPRRVRRRRDDFAQRQGRMQTALRAPSFHFRRFGREGGAHWTHPARERAAKQTDFY